MPAQRKSTEALGTLSLGATEGCRALTPTFWPPRVVATTSWLAFGIDLSVLGGRFSLNYLVAWIGDLNPGWMAYHRSPKMGNPEIIL